MEPRLLPHERGVFSGGVPGFEPLSFALLWAEAVGVGCPEKVRRQDGLGLWADEDRSLATTVRSFVLFESNLPDVAGTVDHVGLDLADFAGRQPVANWNRIMSATTLVSKGRVDSTSAVSTQVTG